MIKAPSPSSSSSSPAKSDSLEYREEDEVEGDEANHEDGDDDGEDDVRSIGERSPSPAVPEGQYEVEKVVDYVRDETGEMFFVKWKNWEESLYLGNSKKPLELPRCLIEFYLSFHAEYDRLTRQSDFVITQERKNWRS